MPSFNDGQFCGLTVTVTTGAANVTSPGQLLSANLLVARPSWFCGMLTDRTNSLTADRRKGEVNELRNKY